VGRWTPYDATLMATLPPDPEILRVPGPEPRPGGRWRSRTERWLLIESSWDRWWIDGSTLRGSEARDIDVVYAVMSPYASAEAAVRLSRALGVPWVADLGDPWALDEMIVYPSRLHRRLELRTMGRILGTAAAVSMSTEEAADRVRRRFRELDGTPVVAIPNGFDARDFAGPAPVRKPDVFRIVHTGYLHTALGRKYQRFAPLRRILGGAVPGVDVLPRSHIYLLEALDRLFAARPELRGRIELHLAGVLSDADREVIGDNEAVKVHEYVEHAEAVSMMRGADLLFLPMHDVNGSRATIVPGKTYEYLASDAPILAAVPAGDAKELMLTAGNTSVCAPTDVSAMVTAIEARVDAERVGRASQPRRQDVVAQYEYRHLAGRLARLFDGVLS
jgi:hypothetical protein